tara:strand:+ start:8956 stop:9501 length:546 start_codon:yes stop_codon:yes gene_type:complete
MEIYKLKWTRLQNEIFRLLCVKTGKQLNQRTIANLLGVSPTAVAKAIVRLENDGVVLIKKDDKMNLTLVELNRDGEGVIDLKRVENLKMFYRSGVVDFLEENFPGCVIILFGSYSYGEDTINSDIDLAVIGGKDKTLNLGKFEKLLGREIRINFYDNFKTINKNLRSNLCNGIVLAGRLSL